MKKETVMVSRSEIFLLRVKSDAGGTSDMSRIARMEFPYPLDEMLWNHKHEKDGMVCLAGMLRARADEYRRALKARGVRCDGIGFKLAENEVIWLEQPIQPPHARVRDAWLRHQNALLAGTAAFLVACGVFLGRVNERKKEELLNALTRFKRLGLNNPSSPSSDERAVSVFMEIAKRLPSGVYLSDYSFDAAMGVVSIKGRCVDYGKVSALTQALSQVPMFQSLRTDKSNLYMEGERQFVEFAMGAILV